MTDKKIVQEAYEEAQKDLVEQRKKEVKKIVKKTLEKIKYVDDKVSKLKAELKELEKEKKLLRLDIEDLKDGRLDRLEERQKKDKKAKDTSVIKIEKVVEKHHHHHYDRWHEPWKITWVDTTPYYTDNTVFCQTSCNTISGSSFTLDNSTVKFGTSGTYQVGDDIVHLT